MRICVIKDISTCTTLPLSNAYSISVHNNTIYIKRLSQTTPCTFSSPNLNNHPSRVDFVHKRAAMLRST